MKGDNRFLSILVYLCLFMAAYLGSDAQHETARISLDEYRDKVYGFWLGQCVGNIYGLPHENRYISNPGPSSFPYGYQDLSRLRKADGAFSDDDTDIEYIYLLAMEKHGVEPTYSQLSKLWTHHIRDRIWLANRAALASMHHGYEPPYTGNRKINPHWFQIDAQLINEIWAAPAPGMIQYAAQKSGWAARITNDDWGVQPTIFYGAMISAAFFETDVEKLIEVGLKALPAGARYAQTVVEVRRLYHENPNDWKTARSHLVRQYYEYEGLEVRSIWNANLNGACGILALLYGSGDFQRTLDLACAIGMDADNQAATLAGLLGIVHGSKGIPENLLRPLPDREWYDRLNDRYRNVSRHDMKDASIRDMAKRIAEQGEAVVISAGGERIKRGDQAYLRIDRAAEYVAPLEFPKGPQPVVEVGVNTDHRFQISGGVPPFRWYISDGKLPIGIFFSDGRLRGVPRKSGVFPVQLMVSDSRGESAALDLKVVIRGPNLAREAVRVLAGVVKTNNVWRNSLSLSIPFFLFSDTVENIIRDGVRTGRESTFYSIKGGSAPQIDYYGYEWKEEREIGLIGFNTGSVEENGGWFEALGVEYRDRKGEWRPVSGLFVSPELPETLPPDIDPYNRPHFVEYLVAFSTIKSNAIRIVGPAGHAEHWQSPTTHFTSITELSVHGPLKDLTKLKVPPEKKSRSGLLGWR